MKKKSNKVKDTLEVISFILFILIFPLLLYKMIYLVGFRAGENKIKTHIYENFINNLNK